MCNLVLIMTKLDTFMKEHGVTAEALSEKSRKSLKLISLTRQGHEPNLKTMKALALGCAQILKRQVTLDELFDLTVPEPKARKTKAA